jgi:hypothetical protein
MSRLLPGADASSYDDTDDDEFVFHSGRADCGCDCCLSKTGPARESALERIDAIKEILQDFYSHDKTLNKDQVKRKADARAMKLWLHVEHNEFRE